MVTVKIMTLTVTDLCTEGEGVDDLHHVLTPTPQLAGNRKHFIDGILYCTDISGVRVLRIPNTF